MRLDRIQLTDYVRERSLNQTSDSENRQFNDFSKKEEPRNAKKGLDIEGREQTT